MIIRTATINDLPAMLEIYNHAIKNTLVTFAIDEMSLEERLPWFEEHNKDNHPLYVYDKDGEVVAYVCLSTYRNMQAYNSTVELSVYVHHEHQGMGIGNTLMEFILDIARKDPTIHMVISVITSSNERSIKMHEKFGFEFSGRIREAGFKFGKYHDIVNFCLIVD
ncbi:MAG: N-acetyltransferase [Anaerofustis stercorihominis]|nr:N-acetyltransferase [Anaerofustis stercorihominis]